MDPTLSVTLSLDPFQESSTVCVAPEGRSRVVGMRNEFVLISLPDSVG